MSALQNIKLLRENKNLSQAAVAEYLEMSRPSYDRVESGEKDLTIPEARKLAEILGVTFDNLLNDTAQEKTELYNSKKYKEMVSRFIQLACDHSDGRITKTKLAKLLYLADFAWFYEHLESMSGLQYRRIPQGPVPDEYFRIIDEMYDDGEIDIKFSGKAMMIDLNESVDEKQQSELTSEQKELMKSIANEWRGARTDAIVNFTHSQLPWRLCHESEIIPYELIIQEDPEHVYRRPVSSRAN